MVKLNIIFCRPLRQKSVFFRLKLIASGWLLYHAPAVRDKPHLPRVNWLYGSLTHKTINYQKQWCNITPAKMTIHNKVSILHQVTQQQQIKKTKLDSTDEHKVSCQKKWVLNLIDTILEQIEHTNIMFHDRKSIIFQSWH